MTPPCGLAEVPQRRPGCAHHRRQRDVEDAVPFVVGHVDDGRLPAEAGVVHQDVDAAHLLDRPCEQRVDGFGRRHVAHHRFDATEPEAGEFVAGLTEPTFVVVGDDDIGALGKRPARGRRPDAGARRGRHQHDLAGQQTVAVDFFGRDRESVIP